VSKPVDILLTFIVNFTDLFAMSVSSILFVNNVLHWKIRNIKGTTVFIGVIALLGAMAMTFSYYATERNDTDWNEFISGLLVMLLYLLGWITLIVRIEGKVWKRAVVSFIALGIMSAVGDRFSYIPDYICEQNDHILYHSLLYIGSSLLLLLFVWFLSRISRKRANRPIRTGTVVLLGTLLFVFEEVVLNLFSGFETDPITLGVDFTWAFTQPESPESVIFFMVLNITLYFVALIIAFFIFAQRSENQYYKDLIDANANYLRAQAQYYEAVEKSDTEIRKIRHDMKNNLTVLSLLLENGDHDRMRTYLAELDASVQSADTGIRNGKSIADAILFDKERKAEEAGCTLRTDGAFTYVGMSAIDTCAIIGNLLDNAIEAASQMPPEKREISLRFSRTDNYFFISQTNPSRKVLISDNNILSTSKNDKKNHGFGLLNLKEAVARYNGETKITCEPTDNELYEFRMEIMIPFD
jgi:signal transduction histidine kinase